MHDCLPIAKPSASTRLAASSVAFLSRRQASLIEYTLYSDFQVTARAHYLKMALAQRPSLVKPFGRSARAVKVIAHAKPQNAIGAALVATSLVRRVSGSACLLAVARSCALGAARRGTVCGNA